MNKSALGLAESRYPRIRTPALAVPYPGSVVCESELVLYGVRSARAIESTLTLTLFTLAKGLVCVTTYMFYPLQKNMPNKKKRKKKREVKTYKNHHSCPLSFFQFIVSVW